MFFERFSALCAERGESKTAVIVKLGFSKSRLQHWSEGGDPSVEILQKVADYFTVSTDYLLGKTNDPTPPGRDPSDIYIIMRNPEGVTPEEREGLVEYLKDSIDVYINARKREAERKK